jgi:hypothetical protein
MTSTGFNDEIFDYYTPPFWETTWFAVTISIVLVGLIALAIVLYLRMRKKPMPAWEWALLELQKISPNKCLTKEDFKRFYFNLTALTKAYLHKRFVWDTEDKTDMELIKFLEQQAFDKNIIETFKKIADGALWIKFANMDALKSQADADWNYVVSMIHQTKPVK